MIGKYNFNRNAISPNPSVRMERSRHFKLEVSPNTTASQLRLSDLFAAHSCRYPEAFPPRKMCSCFKTPFGTARGKGPLGSHFPHENCHLCAVISTRAEHEHNICGLDMNTAGCESEKSLSVQETLKQSSSSSPQSNFQTGRSTIRNCSQGISVSKSGIDFERNQTTVHVMKSSCREAIGDIQRSWDI